MEKLYPSNKVRFRHLYDKTDKEEQILFYRCSLMVETYIKIHVRNQEDVYNLRQEVLLKVVEGLDKSYHERGRFFQWAMTITINMVNDYYRRKKNAPTMVALDNEAIVAHTAGYSSLKIKFLLKFERVYLIIREIILFELSLFERELIIDLFFKGLSFREAGEKRGISKSTCFKLYKKIIAKIRDLLKERGIDFTFLDEDL